MFAEILLTLLIALIGTQIARLLKIPIPYMLGAMFMVATVNIFVPDVVYMPNSIKIFTQAVTGTYIGQTIRKSDLIGFKKLLQPIIILIGVYSVFTIIMGTSLHHLFDFDWATSFLVAVPGGVVDMSLISYDLGANPSVVSIMQSSRLIFVLSTFPILIKKVNSLENKYHLAAPENSAQDVEQEVAAAASSVTSQSLKNNQTSKKRAAKPFKYTLLTLIIGLAGGAVGHFSGLPAGPLSFSLITVALFNVNTDLIYMPIVFRRIAQVAAGSLIGTGILRSNILEMKKLILPIIVVMVGYIIASSIISFLILKARKLDLVSALFASSPGGASDMALIASELNSDTPKIAVMQVSRLVLVIILFPLLVKFLLSILT